MFLRFAVTALCVLPLCIFSMEQNKNRCDVDYAWFIEKFNEYQNKRGPKSRYDKQIALLKGQVSAKNNASENTIVLAPRVGIVHGNNCKAKL